MTDTAPTGGLEVVNVTRTEPGPGLLRGFSIDLPKEGDRSSNHELGVAGWALGRETRAVAVEFSIGDVVIQRFPLKLARLDVASSYPELSETEACGFVGRLSLIPSGEMSIGVEFVLRDQTRVPAAAMRVREPPSTARDEGPLVSVVIPCFRQAHLLPEAIGSALRQSHRSIEVIVVDDGSPDNTEEVVRGFPGVRYVRQENRGLAEARNTGLSLAMGRYLIFLDADDRLLPEAMTSGLVHFAENPEYGFVAGHFRFIGYDGATIASPEARTPESDFYVNLLRDYSIGPPGAVIFRREVFDKVGPFDGSISPAADYDMVMKVAAKFPVCAHRQIVLEYRRHGANMSGDPAAMLRTTMRAIRHQRSAGRASEEGRRAYAEGIRHWRDSWGEALVEKAGSDLREGHWRGPDLWSLLRYYPRGLLKLVKF